MSKEKKYSARYHNGMPGWVKIVGMQDIIKEVPECEGGGIAFKEAEGLAIITALNALEGLRAINNSKEFITHYNLREGGEWLAWRMSDTGVPDERILQYVRTHVVTDLAIINQCAVFAFKTSEDRIWDVKAGWRLVLDEKKFLETEKEVDKPASNPCKCGRWPNGSCDSNSYDMCKIS